MMVGLHGCGKTTTCGKLAKLLSKQGRKPLLVACDVHRPAAIDQLETLGKQLGIPVFSLRGETDVVKIAKQATAFAQSQNCDVVIFDTAGRLHIDETWCRNWCGCVKRWPRRRSSWWLTQRRAGAVNIVEHFDKALNITGIVLTKLDGDARGGAALSMRAVTASRSGL